MNDPFTSMSFWLAYLSLDEDEIEIETTEAARLFRRLACEHPSANDPNAASFSFSCGERYDLALESRGYSERNLSLVDRRSGTGRTLGWWDLAGWHPFCLRLEELDALVAYWSVHDPRWGRPAVASLLFCQFVGLPDENARGCLRTRVADASRELLGEPFGEEFLDSHLQVADGDYRWDEDPELGWTFSSDEYCCYSIRNRAHLGSGEGSFPFAEFRELMDEVRRG